MIATLDHHAMLVVVALATVMCALLLVVALLFVPVEPVQTLPGANVNGISTNSYGTGGANLNGHPSIVEINRTMSL